MGSPSLPDVPRRIAARLAAVGLVLLLVVGVGGMAAMGLGPFAGDAPANSTTTPAAGGSVDGGGPGAGHVRPFSFDVRAVEPCGTTCRDVTVMLTNNGGKPREDVAVATTISAGDDRVWSGETSVGTLGPRESTTRTQRVDVGFVGGARIRRNGGVATVRAVVRWSEGSATFRERWRVS